MELSEIRKKIDNIDDSMLDLFLKRMELSRKAADYKSSRGMAILNEGREREILDDASSKSGEMAEYARRFFAGILELSRDYQLSLSDAPIYGLLGRKLGHSLSPMIHRELGNPDYRLFELEPEELADFLRKTNIGGLNVTIPYKLTVMKYLDNISPEAADVGAVNTIVNRGGRLCGYNTDVVGFLYMVKRAEIELSGKKAVVLGSGGASKTAVYCAKKLGASEVTVISRSGEDNYTNLSRHADAEIIVNCTPVGMYPNNGQSPVDLTAFPRCRGVIDVIYNPMRTALIMQAESLGIPCAGGLAMLTAQAHRAAELFFDKSIEDDIIDVIAGKIAAQCENIVLIGMPGSGKTTIGGLLGRITGRPVCEIDKMIAQTAGKSIPAIFAEDGEDAFRQLEHDAVCQAGKNGGGIIVTGGGVVTREENYEPLHQNGRIYRVERDVAALATDGRPLSKDIDTVKAMYEARKPMYDRFADVTVDNNGTAEAAAKAIWRDFNENSHY